jgi:membrane protease YdiL (CAAX protease family)
MSDESSSVLTPPSLPAETAPPATPPKSKLRWGIHLAIMAALPLVAGLSGSVVDRKGPALTSSARGLLVVSGFEVLFFAVFLGLAWLASRASKDDLLLRWRPRFWVFPLGAMYSVAIRITVGIVAWWGLRIAFAFNGANPERYLKDHQPNVGALVDLHALANDPTYFWLNVLLVSFVVGGLREELWRSSFLAGLRALWPRTFSSNRGGIAAAAVAAIFFGAGHLPQGTLAAMMVTIVGFLLGVIMTVHRSIWPSVIAHGFFDAASMSLILLLQYLPQLRQALECLKEIGH